MLGKKCTSKSAILHLIVRLESGLLGYYEDYMETFCKDSTSQKELHLKRGGQKGKGREHKEGQGRSESAQIQRGRDTPLTAKSGMEFVTISNLDALGLWDRQGQAGEDSLELTLLCPTEYKGSSKPRP